MQGFIVVTPMCTRKPLACSKKGAESTGKDTAEIDVGALTATLKATQHQLKVQHLAHQCLLCS